MLRVKSVTQTIKTYEVPDAITGDFLRWLSVGKREVNQYKVDEQVANEVIVHADRSSDRPVDSTEQGTEASAGKAGNGDATTK